jgi:5-hydroxyisourate hydrolase-like protein (transthyretin family)
MTATITENYGQLRVTETAGGKPVPKVYVKVYAKLADGSVKFHKDGYTDLRGRFDYVSVNTQERQAIERFSILVLSEDRGAIIREAAPPQR